MHEKRKIYTKHPNSGSTIGIKNPVAENPKIKIKKLERQENTLTINDLVDDAEPDEHKKSFVNQNLPREVKYIGRNKEEPVNIGYNKEKIENYTLPDENILSKKTSSFEPDYTIIIGMDHDGNFLNTIENDGIPNPYISKIALCEIHDSDERNEFKELYKVFLSIDCWN